MMDLSEEEYGDNIQHMSLPKDGSANNCHDVSEYSRSLRHVNNPVLTKHMELQNPTFGYRAFPYGWHPPNVNRESLSENEKSQESGPMAILDNHDMVDIYSFAYVNPGVRPVIDTKHRARAKKASKQISQLLLDKNSTSRGSRMFQKRRKRAARYTIVAYGTKPTEDVFHDEVPDSEISSEELSRIEYSSDDEQISSCDKSGVNNELQGDEDLNELNKIRQFKNSAMDVGSMAVKGAKIFARCQQRMDNYVITDENRKQGICQSDGGEVLPKAARAAFRGPDVRPGSSTVITPKAQYNKQTCYNKPSSGYFTDVEDDHSASYKPQLTYFSDVENSAPEQRSRRRRSRPINRRAWVPHDAQSNSEQETQDNVAINDNESYCVDYSSTGEEIPASVGQFRRVIPPGRGPYQFQAGCRGSRDSSLSRASLSPARPASPLNQVPTPKRTWTRVVFCPRKPITQQNSSETVIDYPCARKYTSPGRPPMPVLPGSPARSSKFAPRAASAKPPMLSPNPRIPQKPTNTNQLLTSEETPIDEMRVSEAGEKNTNMPQTKAAQRKSGHNSVSKVMVPQYKSAIAVSLLERPTLREKRKYLATAGTENNAVTKPLDFAAAPQTTEEKLYSSDLPQTDKQGQDEQKPSSTASEASYVSSNSSTYTSVLPSRCLTPPTRPYTPAGSSRLIKIPSNAVSVALEKPLVPVPTTQQNSYKANIAAQPAMEDKILACLKVLDHSKILFKPEAPVQFQCTPTLNAILQSETEETYGAMTTPPMTHEYRCKKIINIKPAPASIQSQSKPTKYSYQPSSPTMKNGTGSASQTPQPLGVIAEGMKGKGAKMFEKQLKRMERYTKETSKDDFPEMQPVRNEGATYTMAMCNKNSYPTPLMAGFSPTGKKLEPGSDVRNGMREVMGEFQKTSKNGKAKRPSETKKKGRDPLYYQQHLFYRPPSAADFVESQPNPTESLSDDSSSTSSKPSSLSSFKPEVKPEILPARQINESKFLSSPTTSKSSLGGEFRSTNSSSSISSAGPKTAPKPPRAIIERQLSKPPSLVPLDPSSPTPESQLFKPTAPEDEVFSFRGIEAEKSSKCIEDLIKRTPDDHRKDANDDIDVRQRVTSIDALSSGDM